MTPTSTLTLLSHRACHCSSGEYASTPSPSKFLSRKTVRTSGTRIVVLAVAVVVVGLMSGCATGRGMMWKRHRDPMAGAPCLKNISNPPIEEVVEHLNQNTDRIHSWQAKKVKIRVDKFSFHGMIAVEKDRRLRLLVNSMRGSEVDLGSNDERFWVWAREMDPGFVTCKHENMDATRHRMGIPFEPDWLMQTLGVARLPTSGVSIEVDPEHEQARLVEQIVTAHGLPLRRVVLVDLKRGIVLEHSLYNNDAVRIALAKLSDHRLDQESGAVLAHHITLDWPQSKMTMSMDLGEVQINPTSISSDRWELPEIQNTQVVHLDAGVPSKPISGAGDSPAAERWEPVQTVRSHDVHNFLRDEVLDAEEELDAPDNQVDAAEFADPIDADGLEQNGFTRKPQGFAHESESSE